MTKLSALSVEELLAEVNRRRKALPKLLKQKAEIQEKLTAIEEEIQALDSDAVKSGKVGSIRRARQAQWAKSVQAPTAARNKRARNNISLMDAVLRVLQTEKSMSIPDIMAAVVNIGYQSKSRNFAVIIGQTLRAAGEKVVRVKRGAYALAG